MSPNTRYVLKGVCGAMLVAALTTLSSQASAFVVDLHQTSTGGIGNLAMADAVIAAPGSLQGSAFNSIVEFDDLGDFTRGNFAIDNPWPTSIVDSFAAHVTGVIYIGSAGDYTFALNHDDGARLRIDGIDVLSADGVVDNRDTLGSISLTAGHHTVDIVMFENFGGASLEFTALAGIYTEWNREFTLVRSVPEPATLSLLALGLAGLGFIRRRRFSA